MKIQFFRDLPDELKGPLEVGNPAELTPGEDRALKCRLDLLVTHFGLGDEKPSRGALAPLASDDELFSAHAFTAFVRLALEFIPGLQAAKKRGRPKKWEGGPETALLTHIHLLEQKGNSTRSACHILARQKVWEEFMEGEGKPNTLYRRVMDLRKKRSA